MSPLLVEEPIIEVSELRKVYPTPNRPLVALDAINLTTHYMEEAEELCRPWPSLTAAASSPL